MPTQHLQISVVLLCCVESGGTACGRNLQRCWFFAELLPAFDRFLVKGILPEIIGRWYTRQSVMRPTSELDAAAIPTVS